MRPQVAASQPSRPGLRPAWRSVKINTRRGPVSELCACLSASQWPSTSASLWPIHVTLAHPRHTGPSASLWPLCVRVTLAPLRPPARLRPRHSPRHTGLLCPNHSGPSCPHHSGPSTSLSLWPVRIPVTLVCPRHSGPSLSLWPVHVPVTLAHPCHSGPSAGQRGSHWERFSQTPPR